MTAATAAAFLGVTEDLLAAWRYRGVGPPFIRYDTGKIAYDMAMLQAYKEAHTQIPARFAKPKSK